MGGDNSSKQPAPALGSSDDVKYQNHIGNGYAPNGEGSSRSGSSTPELDQDGDLEIEQPAEQEAPQQPQQPQKRKGGRKPIYATSEERKQRNRQAQAAFRERRTEYIKQLETTIKAHEETLTNLQASHRTAADECLMLRYKNSLLERILIEKGIDVQAELRAKTGSPNLIPTRVGQGPPSAPSGPQQAIPRFPINKFNRRSLSALPNKSDGLLQESVLQTRSPLSQPTTISQLTSPIAPLAKSPNFLPQGSAISPSFPPVAQQNPQIRPQPGIRTQFATQRPNFTPHHALSSAVSSTSGGSNNSVMSANSSVGAPPRDNAQFFPSPFQNHYDQLEQEYDAQANMIDEDEQAGGMQPFPNAPFPPNPNMTPQTMPQHSPIAPSPNTSRPPPLQPQQEASGGPPNFGGAVQNNGAVFDQYDPMLDADPFGLSASMHFPTQFSTYEQR